MDARPYLPLVEAFLVIEQPRQRLTHWTKTLAPLDDDRAPPLAGITAYYDPTTDQALIGLRYDELALGAERLAFVIEIALLAEIGMIQPAELTDGDRRRFVNERLGRCTIHIGDQRTVVAALAELVRRIRETREHRDVKGAPIAAVPVRAASIPPPIPAARARVEPRGTTEEPVLLVKPRGTRDDLVPQERPPVPNLAKSTRDSLSRMTNEELHATIKAMKPEPPAPPRPLQTRHTRRDEHVRTTSPNVITRADSVHRAETVEMSPIEIRRLATAETIPAPSPAMVNVPPGAAALSAEASPGRIPHAPTDTAQRTEPHLPSGSGSLPQGIIYARYLRSGRWVPIRIGALSLKGAALLTGALPRLHDRVDVALSFGEHRALVRGPVSKVSSVQEAAMSGAATFSVAFDLDDASRRQLTSLLTAARAANVTIKPPPPRHARRYVVEWPVCLGTLHGAVRAEALDVSTDGLFVRPAHALALASKLNFSAVLDEGGSPISGRARVVRHVTEAQAKACAMAPGYGLEIVDMGDVDRERWLCFLGRIAKRSEKRVLLGATPARITELQTVLAAAGYAVTSASDAGALVQLANTAARPVDAALIDSGWLTPGTPTAWVESLFAARNVPYVMVQGDARRARATVDKLLAIL